MRYGDTFFLVKSQVCLVAILLTLNTSPAAFAQWLQVGADIDGVAAEDRSGRSISISSDGNYLAIGAADHGRNGHVRVFSWNGVAWTQVGADIEGEWVDDMAGWSVALPSHATRVAIGATGNDDGADNAGQVRVYNWSGSSWTQLGSDIDGGAVSEKFGLSLAFSSDGDRFAAGGSNALDKSGLVRVYRWLDLGSNWFQMGSDILGQGIDENFGHSVALSADGSRLAVGTREDDDLGTNEGHVRVYDWDGSNWIQVGSDINGEAAGDNSGESVALSSDGSRLAIGAPMNDGTTGYGTHSGHVRVYDWDGMNWTQVGADIDGEAAWDRFGTSVALSSSGLRLAAGAFTNNGGGTNAGHVRAYDWTGSTWLKVGDDIDGEAAEDNSGFSVDLSSNGSRLAIGAPGNNGSGTDAGHVRVFETNDLLPVDLVRFEAIPRGQSAILSWETATETDLSGFEVQRRYAESTWKTLGFVPGFGSSIEARHYEYDLGRLEPGIHLFRLKQVDVDGLFEYSEIIELAIGFRGGLLLDPVNPHPILSRGRIRFATSNTQYVEIWIYDLIGRRMQPLFQGEALGGKMITLECGTDRLPPGQYFVHLESRSGNLARPMVVVR